MRSRERFPSFALALGLLSALLVAPAQGRESAFVPVEFTQTEPADAVAFSPDGQLLAVGGGSGPPGGDPDARPVTELAVWDVKSRKRIHSLKGHTKAVWSVAFSPDGKTLASGGADKTLRLWDVATGKELAVLKDSPRGLYSVAFSPDGKTLAGSVWLPLGEEDPIDLNRPGTVLLWDVETRKVRRTLKVELGAVNRLVFSPNGKALATSASKWDGEKGRCTSGEVWFWDPETGERTGTLKAHASYLVSLAYSPDGKLLATGCDEWDGHPPGKWGKGRVKLWDAATLKLKAEAEVHDSLISALAFGPGGKWLVAGSGPITGGWGEIGSLFWGVTWHGEVAVLDGRTLKEVERLPRHEVDVAAVACGRGGTFATTDGSTVKLWKLPAK